MLYQYINDNIDIIVNIVHEKGLNKSIPII